MMANAQKTIREEGPQNSRLENLAEVSDVKQIRTGANGASADELQNLHARLVRYFDRRHYLVLVSLSTEQSNTENRWIINAIDMHQTYLRLVDEALKVPEINESGRVFVPPAHDDHTTFVESRL